VQSDAIYLSAVGSRDTKQRSSFIFLTIWFQDDIDVPLYK